MSDAELGLDGKPLAAESNPYRVDRPRVPERKYSAGTKKLLKKRQQQRISALLAEGCKVNIGKTGVTVFKGEQDYTKVAIPVGWANCFPADPPTLTSQQRKRRVDRWLENHPGELPRDEAE